MGENESANQITMSWIDPPQIMVLDPHTQHYYWPPFSMEYASIETISEFLESIVNGTASVSQNTKVDRVSSLWKIMEILKGGIFQRWKNNGMEFIETSRDLKNST